MKLVKKQSSNWRVLAFNTLAVVVFYFSPRISLAGAATNAPAAKQEVIEVPWKFPQSSFTPGRDPFFPTSIREKPTKGADGTGLVDPVKLPPLDPYEYMKVTGLIWSRSRPSASINNQSFITGETAAVVARVPVDQRGTLQAKTYQVKVLEIKQKSVRIQIIGEPAEKELILKE